MIYIGSDHAGFELKNNIIEKFLKKEIKLIDKSQKYDINDDYTTIVLEICNELTSDDKAIIICGTGIGSSIAANKINGIRAAVCTDSYMAKMTRLDNDANVLCLGSRNKSSGDIKEVINIIETFLNTKFSNEERHIRRIKKIEEMEERRG